MSHTPGPWTLDRYRDNRDFVIVDAERNVITESDCAGTHAEENARLIAAAPELLAALMECAEFVDNYVDVNDGDDGRPTPNRAMSLHSLILSVIAKAEGRS